MSLAIKPLSDKLILEKSNILLHRIEKWQKGLEKSFFRIINLSIRNIFENYFREFVFKELEFYKKVFDLIKKTCEFLKLAVEDMQAACLMIMSSEVNLINKYNLK